MMMMMKSSLPIIDIEEPIEGEVKAEWDVHCRRVCRLIMIMIAVVITMMVMLIMLIITIMMTSLARVITEIEIIGLIMMINVIMYHDDPDDHGVYDCN